jgi:hypothetical protein
MSVANVELSGKPASKATHHAQIEIFFIDLAQDFTNIVAAEPISQLIT